MLISHYANVVMKGLVSDKFLCMNPQTSELYNRVSTHLSQVHSDCYIQEAVRNLSSYIVYSFKECRTPDKKKCYLGMYRNGTMRAGNQARQSQGTAQWLTVEVKPEDEKNAEDEKETIRKQGGWTAPTATPSPPTPRPVSEKEQRRKRVKRWCRNLSVIRKKPDKFVKRCKRNCDILQRMIADPERSMRHCLISLVRRRIRNKARKRGGQMLDDKTLKRKSRDQAQRLWPRREEIFRRLRHLRRCNLKHRRRPGQKKYSCTKKELRRHERKNTKKRRMRKISQSKSSTTPSGSSVSLGSRSTPRSRRRRLRHPRKRGGRERHKQEEGHVKSRHSETSARDRDAEKEFQSKSRLLTTLTPS
ncbi:uncharacterized protein [Littorina saxatilis]|uniref:uncharacterized protein isoform X1 n=1 Tax=Littorina saxatilis TaxID=31220 RepID=UPI0038B64B30